MDSHKPRPLILESVLSILTAFSLGTVAVLSWKQNIPLPSIIISLSVVVLLMFVIRRFGSSFQRFCLKGRQGGSSTLPNANVISLLPSPAVLHAFDLLLTIPLWFWYAAFLVSPAQAFRAFFLVAGVFLSVALVAALTFSAFAVISVSRRRV